MACLVFFHILLQAPPDIPTGLDPIVEVPMEKVAKQGLELIFGIPQNPPLEEPTDQDSK